MFDEPVAHTCCRNRSLCFKPLLCLHIVVHGFIAKASDKQNLLIRVKDVQDLCSLFHFVTKMTCLGSINLARGSNTVITLIAKWNHVLRKNPGEWLRLGKRSS